MVQSTAGTRIEHGSRSHSKCRIQALHLDYVARLFHIYVVPCCRGKRIPGLGLQV